MQKASFGAGCFWGVEELFLQQLGVVATVVGYMGGNLVNPTYKDVCTGTTGHAEVIEIIFDLTIISYESLLEIFWKNHNPTTLNRQGPDIGTQYRSAIFFHNAQQQSLAELSKQFLKQEKKFRDPIVTEITAASEFYIAEEYHQRYLEKNGRSPCHI
ncbi:MAG: peptide-methionine (S)-S-oxide reductase MsrA [Promethearchaeota archaeon]